MPLWRRAVAVVVTTGLVASLLLAGWGIVLAARSRQRLRRGTAAGRDYLHVYREILRREPAFLTSAQLRRDMSRTDLAEWDIPVSIERVEYFESALQRKGGFMVAVGTLVAALCGAALARLRRRPRTTP